MLGSRTAPTPDKIVLGQTEMCIEFETRVSEGSPDKRNDNVLGENQLSIGRQVVKNTSLKIDESCLLLGALIFPDIGMRVLEWGNIN